MSLKSNHWIRWVALGLLAAIGIGAGLTFSMWWPRVASIIDTVVHAQKVKPTEPEEEASHDDGHAGHSESQSLELTAQADRGVVDVVNDIRKAIEPTIKSLPPGYYPTYEGQFQSQQSASQAIGALFALSLLGMFLLLYTLFRTVNLALQVMAALPMAFIGSVAALILTGQTVTIAAMVGFISLAGIASRNGVLLLQHYLHLVEYEGETFTKDMIVRAGIERLAPVLMTALTAGIALVPLVLAAGESGKEILYPVATVILGGVISSTMLDFFVHPALFWLFGLKAAERAVNSSRQKVELLEEDETHVAEVAAV